MRRRESWLKIPQYYAVNATLALHAHSWGAYTAEDDARHLACARSLTDGCTTAVIRACKNQVQIIAVYTEGTVHDA